MFFITLPTYAQLEQHRWYFGNKAGLDFRYDPPQALNDGQTNTEEGTDTQCDSAGNLLFYTDGVTVWDKSHTIMQNGTGLSGHTSSRQSAAIIKKPGSTTQYYIITTWGQSSKYTVVDLNLNGGLGAIVSKNTLIQNGVGDERVHVIKHSNNIDYWIVTAAYRPFLQWSAFLLTSAGINANPINTNHEGVGYLLTRFIRNGNVAMARQTVGSNTKMFFFAFDKNTGKLSFAQNTPELRFFYRYDASPSGKYLYVQGRGYANPYALWQLDIDSLLAGVESAYVLDSNARYRHISLAPDGKIYLSGGLEKKSLSVINYPERKGARCGFQKNSLNLEDGTTIHGLPHQYYFRDPVIKEIYVANPCASDSTLLRIDVNDFRSVEWSFGDGETAATSSKIMRHNYNIPGTYYVVANVKHSIGNIIIADSIVIHPTPTVELGNDTLLCLGKNLMLNVDTDADVSWNTGSKSKTILATNAGVYAVTLQNEYCTSKDSIHIYEIVCDVSHTGTCYGDSTSFELDKSIDSCTAVFYGTQSYKLPKIHEVEYLYEDAITYHPKFTVYKFGLTKILYDTVTITNPPQIYLGVDSTICTPFYLKNKLSTTLDASILWNKHSVSDSFYIDQSGLYTATTTLQNCVAHDSIIITFANCDCPIYIPNAFTPNQSELNEVFRPISKCSISFTLEVYNRWGENIYNSINSQGWTGVEAINGVYLWRMKVTDEHAKVSHKGGTVTLLR